MSKDINESAPSQYAKKVLLGTILGDGCLVAGSKTTAYLKLCHSSKQIDYLMWKIEVLFPLLGDFRLQIVKDATGKRIHAYTLSKHYLIHIYNDFYLDKLKIVQNNVLHRLTPLSIAVWYMDDGTIVRDDKNRFYGVRLVTDGFIEDDSEQIIEYFYDIWKVQFIKYHHNRTNTISIRTNKDDGLKFLEIVKPYIISSMNYKVDPLLNKTERHLDDDDIVRTLVKIKEFTREEKKSKPIVTSLNEDDKLEINKYIDKFIASAHSSWKQPNPFVMYRLKCNKQVAEFFKERFGGSIEELVNNFRYCITQNRFNYIKDILQL